MKLSGLTIVILFLSKFELEKFEPQPNRVYYIMPGAPAGVYTEQLRPQILNTLHNCLSSTPPIAPTGVTISGRGQCPTVEFSEEQRQSFLNAGINLLEFINARELLIEMRGQTYFNDAGEKTRFRSVDGNGEYLYTATLSQ